jgi:hypothetical protein
MVFIWFMMWFMFIYEDIMKTPRNIVRKLQENYKKIIRKL